MPVEIIYKDSVDEGVGDTFDVDKDSKVFVNCVMENEFVGGWINLGLFYGVGRGDLKEKKSIHITKHVNASDSVCLNYKFDAKPNKRYTIRCDYSNTIYGKKHKIKKGTLNIVIVPFDEISSNEENSDS